MEKTMPNPAAAVLLDRPIRIDIAKLVQALIERHPDISPDQSPVPLSDAIAVPDSTVLLKFSGQIIALIKFNAPLPASNWQPAARRALYWPEAASVCQHHRAYIVVSAMGEGDNTLAVAQAMTAVAGALAATHPACSAVLWSTTAVNSAKVWAEYARRAFASYPEYPMVLWVSVQGLRDKARSRTGMITQGLQAFAGCEVQIEADQSRAGELLDNVYGLVAYLLQPGATIGDGDTFGGSAAERITIRHAESLYVPGVPVYAATLEATQP
jgi:hypothetical protein